MRVSTCFVGIPSDRILFPSERGDNTSFFQYMNPWRLRVSRVWDQENSRRWAWKNKRKRKQKSKKWGKTVISVPWMNCGAHFCLQKSVSLKHEHGLSRQWCSHAAPESFACCSSQQISFPCLSLSLSLSSSSLFPFSDRGSDHRKWIKSRRLVKTPPKKKSFWGSAETWGAAQASGEPECLCRAAVKVVRDSGLPYS